MTTWTTPGTSTALHAGNVWVLANLADHPVLLEQVWSALTGPRAGADAIAALLPDGIGYAIAELGDELRVIVREPIAVTSSLGTRLEGDVTVPIPTELVLGQHIGGVELPLLLGATAASCIRVEFAAAAEVTTEEEPGARNFGPEHEIVEEPNPYLGLLSGEPLPDLPEPIAAVADVSSEPETEPEAEPELVHDEAVEPTPPSPEPLPSTHDLVIAAVRCAAGHHTDPALPHCRWCGDLIPPQTPYEIPRPTLGQITMPNGDAIPLDKNIVMGRAPQHLGNDDQHVVTINTAPAISRMHVLITLDGWNVLVRDLNTTNGTSVAPAGQPLRPLAPGQDHAIEPGSEIDLADAITLRFDL